MSDDGQLQEDVDPGFSRLLDARERYREVFGLGVPELAFRSTESEEEWAAILEEAVRQGLPIQHTTIGHFTGEPSVGEGSYTEEMYEEMAYEAREGAKAAKLHQEGWMHAEIARHLGVSRRTIRQWLEP